MNRLKYIKIQNGYKLYYDFRNDKCALVTGEHQSAESMHIHDFDELVIVSSFLSTSRFIEKTKSLNQNFI